MREEYKNILIIKPSALGDIVPALPALSALRKAYPEAKISWLVRSEFAPLLRNHPDLNEIILFDRTFLGKWWRSWQSLRSLFTLLQQLRNERFDLVIDFQGLFRSAFMGALSGAKFRVGMSSSRELAWLFYHRRIRQSEDCEHLVDYFLRIVETVSDYKAEAEFCLPYDEDAQANVSRLLSEKKVDENNYAVLIPSAAHKYKCWPAVRFAQLAYRLSESFGFSIVAVGSKSEAATTAAVCAGAKINITNLTGRTTLAELIALLRSAKLVVSNDTGPGHIAAGLGVPLVMLFGQTNPARLRPYGRAATTINVPYKWKRFEIRTQDMECSIDKISVDDVFNAAAGQVRASSMNSSQS